jgi:hypothetical protein
MSAAQAATVEAESKVWIMYEVDGCSRPRLLTVAKWLRGACRYPMNLALSTFIFLLVVYGARDAPSPSSS